MNRYSQMIVAILIMLLPAMANAANRVALVIGNDAYLHISTLHTAVADANAMAKALNDVGYDVDYQHDLNRSQLFKAVRNFKSILKHGDEAVFYYAGHGVAINGLANYLLPVDVPNAGRDQVRDGSLALQRILDDLREKKVRLSMVIVDACRDNPFKNGNARSFGTRGLVRERAAEGQMVIYSAGDGQKALDNLSEDDADPNGVFTRVFLKEMKKPGQNISEVVRQVRKQVAALAEGVGTKQVPAVYDQVIGDW
ncbi:MAG: caspase family protein [Mariprofundaceae bacterium]|nr:caspase family protein [Mariprofundaceae bacterium]